MTKMEKRIDDKEVGVFDLIEGLTPIDELVLADFKRTMAEEVIPEILRVVEERRISAAKSREWQLKC
jgi:hypothetical protein